MTASERDLAQRPGERYPAIILFEDGKVDDRSPHGRVQAIHRRIKILTAEGVSRARIRLALMEPEQTLLSLEGRTVGPDGQETLLEAESILRTREPDGTTEVEFRLPDPAPGAIVEYRYTIRGGPVPSLAGWTFQHEIPCLHSTFIWQPALDRTSHWTLIRAEGLASRVVPLTTEAAPDSLEAVRFEVSDVPASPPEAGGPPEAETRARLVTTYTDFAAGAGDYWDLFAAAAQDLQDHFVAQSEKLAAELSSGVPADAAFDQKIRAAYDFVQARIRNVAGSGARAGTADSTLAAGSADAEGMNLMLIAALRTLGIEATRGFVVDRDQAFFHREIQSPAQFSRSLVVVTPGKGQVFFLAPGSPETPPGMIPWFTQGITALLAGRAGALFVTTPVDPPRLNTTTRSADFVLDDTGSLAGGLRLDLSGQPEIEARALNAGDPAGYSAALAADWRRRLPGARIDSLSVTNAGDRTRNLGVRALLSVPRFAREVDGRLLVNPAALGREAGNPAAGAARKSPLFFRYAAITTDNVKLALPRGWKLENLPETVEFENAAGSYQAVWTFDGERVNYQRVFLLNKPMVAPEDYPALKALYETALQGDSELLALVPAPRPPSKR